MRLMRLTRLMRLLAPIRFALGKMAGVVDVDVGDFLGTTGAENGVVHVGVG
jgi:hypothetical protein